MSSIQKRCPVCGTAFVRTKAPRQKFCSPRCGIQGRRPSFTGEGRHWNTSHGHSVDGRLTRTYQSWQAMRNRCTNPRAVDFARYGGRGIGVCQRWIQFQNFLTDMGERPTGTSLDRIDNAGDYSPENCRWATRKEQCRNRRSSRHICYRGEVLTLAEWIERLGLKKGLIENRLKHGWSPARAFETPARPYGVHRCGPAVKSGTPPRT